MDTVDTMGAAGDALRLMVPTISLEPYRSKRRALPATTMSHTQANASSGRARDDFALYVRRCEEMRQGIHLPPALLCRLPPANSFASS
jgi:hypothetical protein